MKRLKKIIVILIILALLLLVAKAYSPIVYCENVSDALMINAKNDIYRVLKELTEEETFKQKYCNLPLFYFLYVKNTQYIVDFINNLPLDELFAKNKYDAIALVNNVVEIYLKNLDLELKSYQKRLLFLANIIYTINSAAKHIYADIASSNFDSFIAPHPDATDNTVIFTEQAKMTRALLQYIKVEAQEQLKNVPKTIGITLSWDDTNFEISFDYIMHNGLHVAFVFKY